MLLIRGQHNLREHHCGCVATIGNFDGVHLGHKAVLEALKVRAVAHALPSLVIIFEPQPLEYFCPDKAPARLTRLREKLALLREVGIDRVMLLRFDQDLSSLTAEQFVQKMLIDALGVKHLFVGDDFCFGKGRTGNFDLLVNMGRDHGFTVENLATVSTDGERVSSTRIREALAVGDFDTAARCLGREYRMCGRVVHGHKKGRTIGFPTLNIGLARRLSPVKGVFAVQVSGLGDELIDGVANVGNRPVLEGDDQFLLEVHLFDFDRQVYGELVSVRFVERLRDERNFESFELMREQILLDAEMARVACERVSI